jgi:signal transduction histidine kinase
MVAHEVKNPLGSLKIFLSILKKDLEQYADALSEDIFEHLIHMELSVTAIDKVVTSMLTSTAGVASRWGPVNLHALLNELFILVSPRITEQEGKIPSSIRVSGSPFLFGDERALRQAFMNLMVNAIEAGDDNRILIIEVCDDKQGLLISIYDGGPGVEPTIRERVFDPFFSTKSSGSGLGLALVKETITAHGGTIKFGAPPDGSYSIKDDVPNALFCCSVWLPRNSRAIGSQEVWKG